MQSINRVILVGNLTRDPELKTTNSGTTVCRLRIATNARVKRGDEWTEKANFFDVTCFGATAENVGKYLAKGRMVGIDGRLDWSEWTTDSGDKRQSVQVIADTIQFLGGGDRQSSPSSDVPVDTSDFGPPASVASPADDDIPF